VTDSLAEVRAVLVEVGDRLGEALGHAGVARERIADAVGVLSDLGEHSEPLVPPQLRRAEQELDEGMRLISGGVAVVADIGARL
jgi:hypothetical protein